MSRKPNMETIDAAELSKRFNSAVRERDRMRNQRDALLSAIEAVRNSYPPSSFKPRMMDGDGVERRNVDGTLYNALMDAASRVKAAP